MITGLINLLLLIDGLIYDLVVWVYEIFEFLTKTNLFDNDLYSDIVKRVYIVLGLIMMFALAYSLLKAVINPDEFSKGETSFPHLIKNVVTSLAIIAVLPTIFTVVFNIQNSLINQNTLPKLVMGDSYGGGEYKNGGRVIAYNAFTAFLHVNEDSCVSSSKVNDPSELTEDMIDTCAKAIKTNNETFSWGDITSWHALINADSEGTDNFYYISKGVEGYDVSFAYFNQFGKAVLSGQLTYTMIISTICGIFLLYVIANFCFDMALRVIKLMFFQIIAPIPVVCRVIPGGKMKDVFSTWVKKTASTFLDVFVRIFVMYLGIFVIDQFVNNWDGISRGNLGFVQALIAKALVIMGIVAFIRQAPKLLAEIFHLDTGGMKLGLREHLKEGGFFAATNAVGSLVTSKGNPLAAYRGWKHGMNNANFHNIGGEANRRRAYKDARAQGVTRTEIFKDRMRRMFGFESSNKADDYNIENRVFTVRDQNGNLIELNATNAERLENEKFENNTRIAEINSSTSEQRDISAENATVISARGTFKSDGLEEIHKADSKILEKLDIKYTESQRKFDLQKLDEAYSGRTLTKEEKDAYDAKRAEIMAKTTSMSLVGNYNSLKAQLEKNYQKGIISDEAYNQAALDLADVEKSMQEKFVTAASHEFGNRVYTNYDGSTIEVDDGGKFNTNYQKLVNDLNAGVLRDTQGRTITLDSFVDGNGNQLEGWDLINAVFKRASGINNEIAIDINNSEREKRTIEQANKAIDAIFDQRTKLREQARNENKYKVRKATSEYNDSNAPKE